MTDQELEVMAQKALEEYTTIGHHSENQEREDGKFVKKYNINKVMKEQIENLANILGIILLMICTTICCIFAMYSAEYTTNKSITTLKESKDLLAEKAKENGFEVNIEFIQIIEKK